MANNSTIGRNSTSTKITIDLNGFYWRGMQYYPFKATACFLIVSLNLIVFATFASMRRKTFSNVLFISIGLSNMLIGFTYLPYNMTINVLYYWPLGDFACILFQIMSMAQWLPSAYSILLLSIHRFMFLTWQSSTDEKMNKKKLALVIMCWLVPYLINTLRYILLIVNRQVDTLTCSPAINPLNTGIYMLVCVILPNCVSLLANVLIIYRLTLKRAKSNSCLLYTSRRG